MPTRKLSEVEPLAKPPSGRRGHLLLIGGGEQSVEAMRKFVELAGGERSAIVLIPTASSDPGDVEYYSSRLRDWGGARQIVVLPIVTREDAARPDYVEAVRRATGIFFGGGDQVRLTDALLDTPVAQAIAASLEAGAIVGGDSAGTACQSERMITGEGNFKVIRAGQVEMKRGFGFFGGVIVDQHFVARQRLNRLLTVVLETPGVIGVGVDEDTAVWVKPDGSFEVVGVGSVIVVDPGSSLTRRGPVAPPGGVAGPTPGPALGADNLTLHALIAGDRYDPVSRRILPRAPK